MDALATFVRLVSDGVQEEQLLAALAHSALGYLRADAAAILLIRDHHVAVVVQEEAPALLDAKLDLEAIGPGLGDHLLALANLEHLKHAHLVPLVAGGDLFGFLALFDRKPMDLSKAELDSLNTLVDAAATGLAQASTAGTLRTTLAELESSRRVLAHTDKLRALGEMAAGVSHDLKNIFCPLLLQIETIRRKAPTDAKAVLRAVDRMEKVLQRGLERVEKLRDFSRQEPESAERHVESLEKLVRDAVELCTMRFYGSIQKIEIVQNLVATPPVALESTEFVAVLTNLMVNAADAMPKGGAVTLSTGTGLRGPWVRVSDTRPGIPESIQQHIFEPFFTTKGAAGTGLGLSMAYAFMQRHGGQLSVSSSPCGATFLLQFPRSSISAPPEPERRPSLSRNLS